MDTGKIYNAVFYTDGSCNPNPNGSHALGVFGYYYDIETLGKKIVGLKAKIDVTDLGVITNKLEQENTNFYKDAQNVQPSKYILISKNLGLGGTNYRAELEALFTAIDNIASHCELQYNINRVLIKSDSQACIYVLQKLIEGTLETSKLKSVDIIERIQKRLEVLISNKVKLDLQHVYGHSSSFGNLLVDRLAYFGWLGVNGQFDRFYEYIVDKKDVFFNPLDLPEYLNFKNIYFLDGHNRNDVTVPYLILEYGTDETIGERSPDVCMGTIFVKNKYKVIEDMIESHLNDDEEDGILFSLNTANFRHPFTKILFNFSNSDVFTKNNKPRHLTVLEDFPLINTIKPSGLASQLLTKFKFSYDILDMYNKAEENKVVKPYDITEYFFKKKVTKNKESYECILDNKAKDITLPKSLFKDLNIKVDIKLVLGTDLPTRNYFKKLESAKDIEIVFYLIKVTTTVYQFCTLTRVIENDNEWVGIWENYYSNQIFN